MQTRFRRGKLGVLAMASVLAVPVALGLTMKTAYAQEAMPTNAPVVTLDIRDARLEEAIAALKLRTGIRDIVIQNPNGKRFAPVTVALTDKPLDLVLRTIARAAGAVVSYEEGIYIVKPIDDGDPTKPITVPTPMVPDTTTATVVTPQPRRSLIVQKIHLMYIRPDDFLLAMRSDNIVTSFEYEAQLQQAKLNRNQGLHRFDDDKLPAPANIEYVGPKASNSGAGVGAGRDDSSLQANQGGFAQGGGGGRGFGGGNFGNQGAGNQGAGGPQNQQGTLRPEGIDAIFSYNADNSLIVKAQTPEAIEDLRQVIRFLDVKPKQVEVRAEFVAVSVNDSDSFGIDWRIIPAGNIDVQTSSLGNAASLSIAYASGNAVASLRAALLRQQTNLIQAPIISTLNNVPAQIQVNDTVPIFYSQQVVTQGVISNVTNIQFSTASNALQVLPHINGDNTITVSLTPQLQSQQNISGPGGQTAPRTSTNVLTTTRIVRNGETMVLGGFITRQDVRSTNETPFLSKLPIIGSLFKSRDHSVQGSETLVFVTPRIIEDTATGSTGTSNSTPAPATTP